MVYMKGMTLMIKLKTINYFVIDDKSYNLKSKQEKINTYYMKMNTVNDLEKYEKNRIQKNKIL